MNLENNFSILIGVYHKDVPEYFQQAMDSVLNQTIKSNDIVLSIDGPIYGDLLDTVNNYLIKYSEIHPIWLPENIGQGKAFQKALPKCQNEIVFRMDSDDICIPTRFERQLNYLLEHPEVRLMSSTISEFTDTTENIVTIKKVPETNNEIIKFARRWNPINHPSAVFYKSDVLAVGSYQDFYRYEDYYLWVRMLSAGYKAANIQDSLLYYRLSSENLKRRMNWRTTKSSLKFHQWKYKIGFTNWFDTYYMIVVMLGIFIIPDFIFEKIYKHLRK
ncbi:glycosyltransferase [Lactococcus cremoris]|uniref:glycosyltransferase n=1 Tax=Lactococcus lactis subsp. cremoris TaxID=1359 RepID=UPI00059ADED7|nr:glycosyltransferase [Lactococcus cremoris]